MHIHCNYLWSRLSIISPALGVIKFTILVDPSLVIIIICLICLIHAPALVRREEILHFHCMIMPQRKNFGRLFLGYYYYIFSLSDLCLGVVKKILKKQCIFTWPHPSTKPPAPGTMKFTILVDPSLFIITMH